MNVQTPFKERLGGIRAGRSHIDISVRSFFSSYSGAKRSIVASRKSQFYTSRQFSPTREPTKSMRASAGLTARIPLPQLFCIALIAFARIF